jgi:hypothetical protein
MGDERTNACPPMPRRTQMKNDRLLDRFGRMTEILKLVSRQRTIHLSVDDPSVIMVFIPHGIRNPNNKGGGRGHRGDRRVLALWDDVH